MDNHEAKKVTKNGILRFYTYKLKNPYFEIRCGICILRENVQLRIFFKPPSPYSRKSETDPENQLFGTFVKFGQLKYDAW